MLPRLLAIIRILKGVIRIAGEAKLGLIAAGVAFFSMLAIFPGVAAVIALYGYFADPHQVLTQAQTVAELLPPDAYDILQTQLAKLVAANLSTLGWTSIISILAALWSARAGVAALIQGVNATHRATARGNARAILTSVLLTLILVGAALIALGAGVIVPIVLAVIPLGPFSALVLGFAKWGISVGAVLFGVSLAYRYGPNRGKFRSRWISPGLLLAVALWAAASVGLSFYISNFASYNRVYGSIGAVIALLMWFYISAYVILLGAALNAELESHRGPEPDPLRNS